MTRGALLIAIAALAVALPVVRARDSRDAAPSERMAVPPLSDEGLPPLPAQSPRNASYTIRARLDPGRHRIDGHLELAWTNTTGQPQSTFPFHLYWNAFRNNLSTSARGEGKRAARAGDDPRRFGYTQVRRIALAGTAAAEAD